MSIPSRRDRNPPRTRRLLARSNTAARRATSEPRLVLLAARFALGLAGFLILIGLLGHAFRSQLEALGRYFSSELGVFGMAAGTFLADGFHFPVPPQFYMLLAIASDASDGWALIGIAAGSITGGACGFSLARRLAHVDWIRRRVAAPTATSALRSRLGFKALAVLSLSPVAFSWLTYFCGLSRYPWSHVALLCVLRLPKLALYYWLVRLGWGS